MHGQKPKPRALSFDRRRGVHFCHSVKLLYLELVQKLCVLHDTGGCQISLAYKLAGVLQRSKASCVPAPGWAASLSVISASDPAGWVAGGLPQVL